MSLLPQGAAIEAEYAAWERFEARLGPALEPFNRLTVGEVAASIACPKHGGKAIGEHCGEARGSLFVCLDRRVAAARASVA
jgi:hypothetical protein